MPKCILCEWPLTLFKCIKILFSRPGAPQSQQASLPGRFLRPEITARTSSCRPLSWNWSWSPPRAVFKASSLLFCSTDTHLQEDKWRDYKKRRAFISIGDLSDTSVASLTFQCLSLSYSFLFILSLPEKQVLNVFSPACLYMLLFRIW